MADEKRYTFLELSEKAKERVMNRRADWLLDDDWHECVIDDWINHVRETVGIEIDRETINFEVGDRGRYATFKYTFYPWDAIDGHAINNLFDMALKDVDIPHKSVFKKLFLADIDCVIVEPMFSHMLVETDVHLYDSYENYSRIDHVIGEIWDAFVDFLDEYFRDLADELADALEDRYDSILTDEEYVSEIFEANDIYFDANGNEIDA